MRTEPIRIGSETVRALQERSALSGEPIGCLAQRYIDEGMRLDQHPGIIFRDGPAGRRAVLVGGPDVWEEGIDRFISIVDQEASELEQVLAREQQPLG